MRARPPGGEPNRSHATTDAAAGLELHSAGAEVVIVNDVGRTGDSLRPLIELVYEREAKLVGIVLFAVVGLRDFVTFTRQQRVPADWLMTANWEPTPPGGPTCTGCATNEPLIPISEFA